MTMAIRTVAWICGSIAASNLIVPGTAGAQIAPLPFIVSGASTRIIIVNVPDNREYILCNTGQQNVLLDYDHVSITPNAGDPQPDNTVAGGAQVPGQANEIVRPANCTWFTGKHIYVGPEANNMDKPVTGT